MWRVWYADGSTVDSDSSRPEGVPKTGVQVIRQHVPSADGDTLVRLEKLNGEDFYTWDDDRWTARTREGLFQYLETPGWKIVLFGYEIGWERYQRILHDAIRDPDFDPMGLSRRKRAGLE